MQRLWQFCFILTLCNISALLMLRYFVPLEIVGSWANVAVLGGVTFITTFIFGRWYGLLQGKTHAR
jgi:vacuolar-type H+-ATPase subunit I/STV1